MSKALGSEHACCVGDTCQYPAFHHKRHWWRNTHAATSLLARWVPKCMLREWGQAGPDLVHPPPVGQDCHAASDPDPLWWCWHRLEDWKLGSLTFPSAPSSTPSSPMISFKLTAPVDCFPPSNFKSLGRTSPRENALVYTPKSHDDVYYTRHHSHTDENEYMGSSQQGILLTLLGGRLTTF